MLENPLLIRRPLMQVGDTVDGWIDQQAVDNWIGLQKIETASIWKVVPGH